MKNKNYHTVPKSIKKNINRKRKMDTPNTHIHDRILSWLDTPNTHIHDRILSWLCIDLYNSY